ncbi:MAG: TetR/AcrR family transcriptional regulator, partial [Myxococcota bacterium]
MARRTQAERSAATREALVLATLDLLEEHGWAGVNSVAVCKRAGLTRGAFGYHFANLHELYAAALEHRNQVLVDAFYSRPAPTDLAELVSYSWDALTATDYAVVIEAWLAAAKDPELRAAISPVVEQFAKLVVAERRPAVLADEFAESFYLMARETMFGLALGRATNGGPLAHEERVLEHLLRLAYEHDARS